MKMKIEIRNDKAVVSGYVNAVGRDSRPITDVRGKFVEQIEPGAFRASLERSENVDLLLNHDKSKVYASTKDGSLKLTEDSIGLRAEAVLTDAEMIRKARSGEFRGWSFGMYVGDSAMEERAEGIPRRHVKSLNMFEVSLIDKSRIPCYVGTSVECRAEGEDVLAELRYSEEEPEIVEEERSEPEPVDYSAVDDVISELRYGAVDNAIAELRYNPYHDPSNGRFTSGGGGGGVLVVEKGQKGKGYYVVDKNNGEDFDDDEYKKWSEGKSGAKRQLDQTQIDRANAQGSNIYEAGSAIARTYDREYDEIGNLNISDAEKAAARDKIYEFSAAELQARQKYYDFYTAGPARKVSGSDKALEKSMNISSEHQSYMNSLRDKSAKNTSAQKEKAFSSAFNAEAQKANASGAREITVNGETWFRTTKTSSTWTKGTLKEYQAKKNFQKSQKDLPMVKRRGWSELSADEKAQYYRSFDPIDSVIEELRYNPYHDPSNGRFCSGGGGGGGVLVVEKGQKGKGVYVVDVDHDEEYKKWKAEKQNGNDAFAELPEEPLYKYGSKDLPQLTGSAEEIKEAKKIRSKTLQDAQYYALTKLSDGRPSDLYKTASLGKQAMIDSINNSALVKATWDPNVKQQKISDKVAGYKDTYARNQRFGDILSQTSAKFWLDHDTNTPKNYMNLHFKDYIDGKTKL